MFVNDSYFSKYFVQEFQLIIVF